MTKLNQKFDLEERTAKFGGEVIELCKKVTGNVIIFPIIDQLIRAGTSVGANYCEANGASSKKDFRNKIFICKKEAKEAQYWFRMLAKAVEKEEIKNECRKLWQEAKELSKIFAVIAIKTE